ncbi:hypothetical protein BZA77DRAFT_357920 [Pyronema omphalodes]|nr:hypothetical protein BZA77DRAFT_357920 [Pyronema omphalodes]
MNGHTYTNGTTQLPIQNGYHSQEGSKSPSPTPNGYPLSDDAYLTLSSLFGKIMQLLFLAADITWAKIGTQYSSELIWDKYSDEYEDLSLAVDKTIRIILQEITRISTTNTSAKRIVDLARSHIDSKIAEKGYPTPAGNYRYAWMVGTTKNVDEGHWAEKFDRIVAAIGPEVAAEMEDQAHTNNVYAKKIEYCTILGFHALDIDLNSIIYWEIHGC